ncbi:MAG: maleylpyruvate isomerase family mycothiol-dependent enzyme [Actinobacteria bacterium]|nr:maleylpyruvate isomerase family mycothiol-dependent enzyme [Actinomycetota bacterium]
MTDRMEGILSALTAQHADLDAMLDSLDDAQWAVPVPRCPGWTVADVVVHLAQTDELAAASASGDFEGQARIFREGANVDEGAAEAVDMERGASSCELLRRWRAGSVAQHAALSAADLGVRLPWVTNTLSPATLATTRLSESWIHTGDIADALGITLPSDADRLHHIAWLAWATLPYAFEREGSTLLGPVAVTLDGPDGKQWRFGDEATATTRVTGPGDEWCAVAARRVEPAATRLIAEGPDAEMVLALVRTYA